MKTSPLMWYLNSFSHSIINGAIINPSLIIYLHLHAKHLPQNKASSLPLDRSTHNDADNDTEETQSTAHDELMTIYYNIIHQRMGKDHHHS